MKNNKFAYTTIFIACLFLFNCQDREGCTDPASDNFDINAEVDNGTCVPMVEKFIGLYDVEEVCEYDIYTYPMSISATFYDPFEISISNFADLRINIVGSVDRNLVLIPDQIIQTNTTEYAILDGRGEIINGNISIRYWYSQNGSVPELCRLDGLRY